MSITSISCADDERVFALMTLVFSADPATRWMFPDPQQYLILFPKFAELYAGRAFEEGEPRSRLARDSFTYLHFPMVVGIVFLALGMKKVVGSVSDATDHQLSDPLTGMPLVALYGGIALAIRAPEIRDLLGMLRRRRGTLP
jgi:hypothetical protein